jgi:hypothetical protein
MASDYPFGILKHFLNKLCFLILYIPWVDTSTSGLLVSDGIIHTLVSV